MTFFLSEGLGHVCLWRVSVTLGGFVRIATCEVPTFAIHPFHRRHAAAKKGVGWESTYRHRHHHHHHHHHRLGPVYIPTKAQRRGEPPQRGEHALPLPSRSPRNRVATVTRAPVTFPKSGRFSLLKARLTRLYPRYSTYPSSDQSLFRHANMPSHKLGQSTLQN